MDGPRVIGFMGYDGLVIKTSVRSDGFPAGRGRMG